MSSLAFAPEVYRKRREKLRMNVKGGIIVLWGNDEVPMNYRDNPYSFRQDSTFLYFTGVNTAGYALAIDLDSGEETLYGHDLGVDEIIWMGNLPSMRDWADTAAISGTRALELLGEDITQWRAGGRRIHFLPPYRADAQMALSQLFQIAPQEVSESASPELIRGIVELRSIKEEREIKRMEKALRTTHNIFLRLIKNALPGVKEQILAGIAEGIALQEGGRLAYPAILSKDGHILHNHHHHHYLQNGDMVLADIGAEGPMGYASDITRTFPVGRTFSAQQRDIYRIVLDAENSSIDRLRPGIAYKDIHLHAARIITDGLKDLGLMRGDTDEIVASGAHALFFPHGLGHMIGLDVHDMENLGEDHVGYSDTVKRSHQFGTAYLRLGRVLESGFVLTVEPGIYFIPTLIDQWRKEEKFHHFIQYEMVERWKNFGGIRIEDNVLITEESHRVLGPPIPKTIEEIEALKCPPGSNIPC